eukprot:4664309-Pyramimonas_sp.AAC.1
MPTDGGAVFKEGPQPLHGAIYSLGRHCPPHSNQRFRSRPREANRLWSLIAPAMASASAATK